MAPSEVNEAQLSVSSHERGRIVPADRLLLIPEISCEWNKQDKERKVSNCDVNQSLAVNIKIWWGFRTLLTQQGPPPRLQACARLPAKDRPLRNRLE